MAACVLATSAQAGLVINGAAYLNAGYAANLTGFTPAAGTLEATFTSSALNFDSNVGGYTLNSFLNTVPGTTTFNSFSNGATGMTGINNTVFEFTGTALFTKGVTYTSRSDDGEILKVNGVTVVNMPTPQVATDATYTVAATGNYSFDFLYGETMGPPAVFITPLTAATPEPGYLGLVGIGISAVFFFRRRKLNS